MLAVRWLSVAWRCGATRFVVASRLAFKPLLLSQAVAASSLAPAITSRSSGRPSAAAHLHVMARPCLMRRLRAKGRRVRSAAARRRLIAFASRAASAGCLVPLVPARGRCAAALGRRSTGFAEAVVVCASAAVRGTQAAAHAGTKAAAFAVRGQARVQHPSAQASRGGFVVGARHNPPIERTAFGSRSFAR
jgi:hypothetical protein